MGQWYIYIAIRRPMKTPESGTEVFAVDNSSKQELLTITTVSFPVDLVIGLEEKKARMVFL
jgi:hypothetical protein